MFRRGKVGGGRDLKSSLPKLGQLGMMGLGGLRDAPWPPRKAVSASAKMEALVPFENPIAVQLSLDLRCPLFSLSHTHPSVALPKELLVLLNWVRKSGANRALELQGRFARAGRRAALFSWRATKLWATTPEGEQASWAAFD